jgi:hypothetical protein
MKRSDDAEMCELTAQIICLNSVLYFNLKSRTKYALRWFRHAETWVFIPLKAASRPNVRRPSSLFRYGKPFTNYLNYRHQKDVFAMTS